MPGPWQTTRLPSPSVQVTLTGVAVTVAVSLGTEAVADRGPQVAGSTHSQVGTLTTWSTLTAGLVRIPGAGSGRYRRAVWASTAGATAGWLSGTHRLKDTTMFW